MTMSNSTARKRDQEAAAKPEGIDVAEGRRLLTAMDAEGIVWLRNNAAALLDAAEENERLKNANHRLISERRALLDRDIPMLERERDAARAELTALREGVEGMIAHARKFNGGAPLHETWLYAPTAKALLDRTNS